MEGRRMDLPSGGWCELRDPHSVTNRERRPLLEKAERDEKQMGESALARLDFADKLACLMISGWSYDLPLPGEQPSALEDVSAMDLDAIHTELMKPANMPFLDMGDPKDPKASPEPSGVSRPVFSTTTSSAEPISLTYETIGSSSSD